MLKSSDRAYKAIPSKYLVYLYIIMKDCALQKLINYEVRVSPVFLRRGLFDSERINQKTLGYDSKL